MKKQLRYFLTLLLVMVASVGWAGSITFGDLGLSNSVQYLDPFDGDDFTVQFVGGANTGKYYTTGNGIRVYGSESGKMVFTAKSGNITEIEITCASGNAITTDYSLSDGSLAVSGTKATWTGNGTSVEITKTGSGHWRVQSVNVTVESGSATAVTTSVTIDNTGITNTDVFAGTAAGQLTATVKDDTDTAIEGATVTWTSSKESVATIAADGTVTLVAEGTTTLTASYAGVEDVYKSSSATYELTVTNSDPDKPGSENNPYTVAEALANTPATGTTANVYVKGIVSRLWSSTIIDDSNNRYYISDDGTTTSELLIYKGKGLDNVAFANADDLLVGDEVVICGGLTTYNSTKEMATGNYIVSLIRNTTKVATPTFSPAEGTYNEAQSVTISTTTEDATIYYTTDGSDPTTESNVYSEAISVTETTTIKAFAVKEGMTDSEIATATYTIKVINVNPKNVGSNYFVKVTDVNELEDGDAILIVYENENESKTMKEQRDNNWSSTLVDIVDDAILPGADAQKLVLTAGGEGKWMFCVGTSADAGFLTAASSGSNYLRTTTEPNDNANAIIAITDGNASIVFQGNYTRNDLRFNANQGQMIFSCYASSSSMKAVQIYKEVEKPTSITVTIGETEYATLYYGNWSLIVPEGVTASAYSVSGSTLNVVQTYNTGDVIPAATGVVLNGAQGEYTFNITEENGTAAEGNMLKGSDTDAETTGGAKYYMLSLNADNEAGSVGFYYGAEGGAAFTNKAHKAYLAVPEGTEAKATGYAFNETTGINSIDNAEQAIANDAWYTIDGKRLNSVPTVKGIYVVNGKKVVIK